MTNIDLLPVINAADACTSIHIKKEQDLHLAIIEELHETVFGPGRFSRAAFRVREQGPYDQALSFVAVDDGGDLCGSVRLTWIMTSQSRSCGLLLGPLCVSPKLQNKGIGKLLVAQCLKAAAQTDASYVMLVGDQPYYGPQGFQIAPMRKVFMPGPVDLNRLLVCPLHGFDMNEMAGQVGHESLVSK